MIRIKQKISVIVAAATLIASAMNVSAQKTAADTAAFQQWLDSMGISKSDLEAKVQSTLMFGGSSPVSFSGEGRLKLQAQQFDLNDANLVQANRSYVESNWEGNESFIRLGMVVRAGRNTVLWSKIGFQNTLTGFLTGLHDKNNDPAIVHEDMNAGIALRTVPASFWLKMGTVQWVEASPFTIWKAQPRNFAWEYLPYEVEQPIARYYEYNLAKGEKSGRAAWNKKPYQGISLESINLPWNMYFNFIYGCFERYDNFEREYVDFTGDLAYAGETSDKAIKGKGIGDSYRHIIHGQFALKELFGKLTPSLDIVKIKYDKDVRLMAGFSNVFGYDEQTVGTKGFIKEPFTGSFDLRGPLTSNLNMHADFALNRVDTTWFTVKEDTIKDNKTDSTQIIIKPVQTVKYSDFHPAFYCHLENKSFLPINADIAYITKGFYSPTSFAVPNDAFFPFGANLIGPGKFIARGEASPYAQNMAGINLQAIPNLPGYGHLKITYGQHFQLQSAQDLVFFPYRLNGVDLFSVLQSSYNRWGNDLVDVSMKGCKYNNRLGDESFKKTWADQKPQGPEAGGIRSDYLGMYEGFVPYNSVEQADSNLAFKNGTIYSKGEEVPAHQKFTFNLELDGSYDIGPFINYNRDFFVGIYGALNGVSSSFMPIAFNDKPSNMMLWGTYLRFEPAIALTNKFYLLGMAGFENWRSQKAYMSLSKTDSAYARTHFDSTSYAALMKSGKKTFNIPIDYRDYAYGIGFDWDILPRVGLHGRVKWMAHDDVNYKANNWDTPIISTEIKMWF